MAAQRFRLYFFTSNSGNIAAQNIEFRATMGGATLCTGGTASASSTYPGFSATNCFANTGQWASDGGAEQWIEYDFGIGVTHDVAEVAYQCRNDGYNDQTPNTGQLQYFDGEFWRPYSTDIIWGPTGDWTSGETKLYEVEPPLPAGDMQLPQGRLYLSGTVVSSAAQISEARTYVQINFPAHDALASQAMIVAGVKKEVIAEVSQGRVLAHCRGRVADPKLRVWTFTLAGHDFFVLRLGDETTLLYDVYSEQWIEWDSKDSGAWRPNVGMTWVGAQALADTYGSAVIAGDDTFGLLWFLDPEQPYDDNPDPARPVQEIEFQRIVTGQVLATGRQQIPCYAIFLDGDNYGLSGTEFTPFVLLEYSDDQGRTFQASDTLGVNADITVNNPYSWYSLGSFGSPGRIFRVTDNGVLTRIDSMSMNDDG